MRAWRSVADAEQPPGSGHAPEFVVALVEEFDVRTGDEVSDGPGHEHFASRSAGRNTLPDVNRDPCDVVTAHFDLPGVHTGSNLDANRMDGIADRARAADGAGGTVKRCQYSIAGQF